MISRLPILDVAPTIYFGGEFVGVKAVEDDSGGIGIALRQQGLTPTEPRVVIIGCLRGPPLALRRTDGIHAAMVARSGST